MFVGRLSALQMTLPFLREHSLLYLRPHLGKNENMKSVLSPSIYNLNTNF